MKEIKTITLLRIMIIILILLIFCTLINNII